MNIYQKIKEVNDYFVNKLVNKDYEIQITDKHSVTLSIDDLYVFTIWLSNGYKHVCTDVSTTVSFMVLVFTEEQKQIIYDNLCHTYNKNIEQDELELYNKLKTKYEK